MRSYAKFPRSGNLGVSRIAGVVRCVAALSVFSRIIFFQAQTEQSCALCKMEQAKRSDILHNVPAYAMFATGIICRRLTSGKYGRRLAEERSKP